MTITTIRVTDKLRAACLRIAVQNQQIVDVVNEDGDTVRGKVLSLSRAEEWGWIAVVEVT